MFLLLKLRLVLRVLEVFLLLHLLENLFERLFIFLILEPPVIQFASVLLCSNLYVLCFIQSVPSNGPPNFFAVKGM